MNILFYRYLSICEPDVIEGFRALGHYVQTVELEITQKNPEVKEVMAALNQYLFRDDFDIVFSINFFPVVSDICNAYQLKYVCWTVDSPILSLYSEFIKNPYNRIFMFDYAQYQEFYVKNPECIFYLPLGANVTRLEKTCAAITKEDSRFAADVSFVGSLYTEKCPYNEIKELPPHLQGYLEGVMEAQLKIYGYNFLEDVLQDDIVREFKRCVDNKCFFDEDSEMDKSIMAQQYLGIKATEMERLLTFKNIADHFSLDLYTGSDTSMLPKVHNCGLANSLLEVPKIFHLSKININTTTKPIRTGIPLRLWEIMGCGGFVLSNFQSEIPEYFEIGKDLVTYSSQEEMLQLIDYYLEHEEERKEIAMNGYRKVKEGHTITERLKEMLESV